MSFLTLGYSPTGSKVSLPFERSRHRHREEGKKATISSLEKLARKLSLGDVKSLRIRRSSSTTTTTTTKVSGRARTVSQSSTGSQSRRLKKSSFISTAKSSTKRKAAPKYEGDVIPALPALPKFVSHPFSPITITPVDDPRLSVHFSALEFLTLDPEPWVGVSLKDFDSDEEEGTDWGLPSIPSVEPDFGLSLPAELVRTKTLPQQPSFSRMRARRESIMTMRSAYSEGSYAEEDHTAIFVPPSDEEEAYMPDTPELSDSHCCALASTSAISLSSGSGSGSGPHTPASSIRTDPLAYNTRLPSSPFKSSSSSSMRSWSSSTRVDPLLITPPSSIRTDPLSNAYNHSRPPLSSSASSLRTTYLPSYRTDLLSSTSPAPPRPTRLRPVGEPLLARRLTNQSLKRTRSTGSGSVTTVNVQGRERPYGYF